LCIFEPIIKEDWVFLIGAGLRLAPSLEPKDKAPTPKLMDRACAPRGNKANATYGFGAQGRDLLSLAFDSPIFFFSQTVPLPNPLKL
jgi:hypothetical protein